MFHLHPQLAADTEIIGDLMLCRVLLMNDSQFPWVILVPRRADTQEMYQLDKSDRLQLNEESHQLSKSLMSEYQGDKLNTGALGNLVPQLHIHHIVRFVSDPAWPKPVWGAVPALPYSAQAIDETVVNLQTLLRSSPLDFQAC